MKQKLLFIFLFMCLFSFSKAQTDTVTSYIKKSYMVPMRDGVKLFTVALLPVNFSHDVPVLIQRTPYGADVPLKDDSTINVDLLPAYYRNMAKEGYIFVRQDIRGKFKSEGTFEMTRPLYHLKDPKRTDESTDASDAVGWLLKNLPHNNGKAGIFGISYLGYTALDAIIYPNAALKAC